MSTLLPHPATLRLLKFQAAARLSRTLHSFRGTRRMALSILAVLLAVIWIGQAGLGILFREPADPVKLAAWIPVGLLAYAAWHLLKTACRTPIEPFEWTPAERELLGGAPIERHELVMYRLSSIGLAAVAKAACFALVMLPDLQIWPAGCAGMLMALLFLELIRLALEIFVYGLPRQSFICFRVVVLVSAAAILAIALVDALPALYRSATIEAPAPLAIGAQLLDSLIAMRTTTVGFLAEAPFRVFASVILATSCSMTLGAQSILGLAMILLMMQVVVWLDRRSDGRRLAAERREFPRLLAGSTASSRIRDWSTSSVRVPFRVWGVGSLAWRQLLGAYHYRTSILVALIVPGVLSCLTLLTPQTGEDMLIQVVAGLVFYSFVLLPTALKFDFRRDVDRLAMIKSLPVSATAITLGQLAAPVLLCTLFQMIVLLVVMAVRPYDPAWFAASVGLLVPVNLLIFSLENLIFMLYPYRLNQEGVGVFLRSVLTFTAKGILFAIGLVVTLIWAVLSRQIAESFLADQAALLSRTAVFVAGLWVLITAVAVGTSALLVAVYRRFDPSQDSPAVS